MISRLRSLRAQVPLYQDAWDRQNERVMSQLPIPYWAVLGDSLSQGIGASTWQDGWVHRCLSQIHEQSRDTGDLAVLNFSRTGATTHDVLERQLAELKELTGQGHQPTLTSLVIGTNDVIRSQHRPHLLDRFNEILKRVPQGTVVTLMPQPIRLARSINHAINDAALDGKVVPVNVRRLSLLSPHNSAADLFTPTAEGTKSWRIRWVLLGALRDR